MKKRSIAAILILAVVMLAMGGVLAACTPQEKLIDHLEMFTYPKSEYVAGQELDLQEAQLLVVYDDGTEQLVKVDATMVSGFFPYQLGVQILTVRYGEKEVAFSVNVVQAAISYVALTPPSKLSYIQGENLDFTGARAEVHFNNGVTRVLSVTESMCTGYDRERLGEQTITVHIETDGLQAETTFDVQVREKILQSIAVHSHPTKRIYYAGDELQLEGGVLVLNYDNNYPERVSMSDALADGATFTWDNTQVKQFSTVTVEYLGFTTSFDVSVVQRDVAAMIVITPLPNQPYGRELDCGNAEVEITYNDESVDRVRLDDASKVRIEGYNPLEVGVQTVTLYFLTGEYENPTSYEMQVTVDEKVLTDFVIDRPEGQTLYEDTDLENLILGVWKYRLHYSNDEYSEPREIGRGMLAASESEHVFFYDEPGEYTLTFELEGCPSVTERIRILPLTITDIRLVNAEGILAVEGDAVEDIDFKDACVEVTYANGNTISVPITADMIEGYDPNRFGDSENTFVIYRDDYTGEQGIRLAVTIYVYRAVARIEAVTAPVTDYIRGRAFDIEEMQLKLIYENGDETTVSEFGGDWTISSEAWAEGATASERIFSETGTFTVTISYAGLEEGAEPYTVEVFVHNDLVSIVVDQEPFTALYVIEGMPLDLTAGNFTLTASYQDDTTRTVRLDAEGVTIKYNYTESWPEGTGFTKDATVMIYYDDPDDGAVTDNIWDSANIVVNRAEAVELEIVALAGAKTQYFIDAGGNPQDNAYEFLEEDLKNGRVLVYIVYNNGKRVLLDFAEAIDMEDGSVSDLVPIGNGSTEGYFTFYYNGLQEGVQGNFWVTLAQRKIVGIEWSTIEPNFEVTEGDDLFAKLIADFAATGIRITYDDGSDEERSLTELRDVIGLDGYNSSQRGTQYPRIIYEGFTLTFQITVKARELVGIRILEDVVIRVVQGMIPDVSGVRFELIYDNGTTSSIVLEPAYFLYDNDKNPGGYRADNLETGRRSVSVAYPDPTTGKYLTDDGSGEACVFTVDVLEKRLQAIELLQTPKTSYIEGEEFDVEGGIVALRYDNGDVATRLLSEAAIGVSTAEFYINNVKFNKEEFSGESRVQTIYIYFRDVVDGQLYSCSYDIIMRDRRYPTVTPDPQNAYNFIYGEFTEETKLAYTLKFYQSMGASDPSTWSAGMSGNFKIEYVPYTERDNPDKNTDYTKLPKNVGQYAVILSWEGDAYNNAVYDNSTYVLTITRRPITIALESVRKTYGAENPAFVIKEVESGRGRGFATGEDFSAAFSQTDYGTPALYQGKQISLFNIVANDFLGAAISRRTGVGAYAIQINGGMSNNYAVTYVGSTFTIERRRVMVTPDPNALTLLYGAPAAVIGFSVSEAYDEEGNLIEESGLLEGDTLQGTLRRELQEGEGAKFDVGEYRINLGTLSGQNPNYTVSFRYSKQDESTRATYACDEKGDYIYLEILPRDLYLHAGSAESVYGEELPSVGVRACADSAGENGNAFYYQDELSTLGAIRYVYLRGSERVEFDASTRLSAGNYTVYALVGEGEEGETNAAWKNNYRIYYVQGTLHVLPRPVEVHADEINVEYGDAEAELSYTTSGVAGNPASGLATYETEEGDLEEETLSGNLRRDAGSAAAEYSIRIGDLDARNPNYQIIFIGAVYRISPKKATLRIDSEALSRSYDGRKPSLAEEAISFIDAEGERIEGEMRARLLAAVSLTFKDASRNAGLYPVTLTVEDANFGVALEDAGYTYQILRKEAHIVYDVPDGKSYTGREYRITAHLEEEDVAFYYNDNGEVMLGDDNQPLKDEIDILLSLTSVRDAGTYTVQVLDLQNSNYELADSAPYTFTVNKLDAYVRLLNATDGVLTRKFDSNSSGQLGVFRYNTDYKVYYLDENGEEAEFTPAGGSNIIYSVVATNPDAPGASVTGVRFNAEGEVIGYPIEVSCVLNVNVDVRAEREYQLLVTPMRATLTFSEGAHLSKSFDGREPSISLDECRLSDENGTPLSVSAFSGVLYFSFGRKNGDNMPNYCVGSYQIGLNCTNRNYEVTLAVDREYQITQQSLVITLENTRAGKTYDTTAAGFAYSDFRWPSYADTTTTPYVRNFASQEEKQAFKTDLAAVLSAVNAAYNAVLNITYDTEELIRSRIAIFENARTAYRNIYTGRGVYSKAEQRRDLFSERTKANVDTSEESLTNYLGTLYAAFEGETAPDSNVVQSRIRNVQDAMRNILYALGRENYYIALVFSPDEGAGASVGSADLCDVGQYTFDFECVDYNRSFTLGNRELTYTISPWPIELRYHNITTVYGEMEKNMKYDNFVTVETGANDEVPNVIYFSVDENGARTIKRTPYTPEIFDAVTSYDENGKFIYTPIVTGEFVRQLGNEISGWKNPEADEEGNYIYDPKTDYDPNIYRLRMTNLEESEKNYTIANAGVTYYHTITPATVTIELADITTHTDGTPIVYGEGVRTADLFRGKYTQAADGSLVASKQWTYGGGLTGPYRGAEEVDSVVNIYSDASSVTLLYEEGGRNFVDGTNFVPVGTYALSQEVADGDPEGKARYFEGNGIEGFQFYTTEDGVRYGESRYQFEYVGGSVTVSKKQIDLTEGEETIGRTYGESEFELTLRGLENGDTVESLLGGPLPQLRIDESKTQDRNTYDPKGDAGRYTGLAFAYNEKGYPYPKEGSEADAIVFDNYELIVKDKTYTVTVRQAPLTVTVVGNGEDENRLIYTYGESPIFVDNAVEYDEDKDAYYIGNDTNPLGYRVKVVGLRNGQTPDDFKSGSSHIIPKINLAKLTVDESGTYDEAFGDFEGARFTMDAVFIETFKNYDITWAPVRLTVNPADVTVTFNRNIVIAVEYDEETGAAKEIGLTEYTADYTFTKSNSLLGGGSVTMSSMKVTGGSYFSTFDFRFEGLQYGEQPTDLFGVTTHETPEPVIPEGQNSITYTNQPFAAASPFTHSLSYPQGVHVGTNVVLIAGMNLKLAVDQQRANYRILYGESTFEVYDVPKEGGILESEEQVVLEGDTSDQLSVIVEDASGSSRRELKATAANGFTVQGFNSAAMGANERTREAKVTYSPAAQKRTDGAGSSIRNSLLNAMKAFKDETRNNNLQYSFEIPEQLATGSATATVKYRVYPKNTKYTDLGDWEVTFTDSATYVAAGGTTIFDGIDILLRAQRKAMQGGFRIYLNGTKGETDTLSLEIYEGQLALIVRDSSGEIKTQDVESGQGMQTLKFATAVMSNAYDRVDLLDGNYHRVILRINLETGGVYVEIDGLSEGMAYPIFVNPANGETIEMYPDPKPSSTPAIEVFGVVGEIREAAYFKQGYFDNYATLPAPYAGSDRNGQAIQTTDEGASATSSADLTALFAPSVFRAGYTYKYYVNGKLAYAVTYDETGSPSKKEGDSSYEFRIGSYTLEMAVYVNDELKASRGFVYRLTTRTFSNSVTVRDPNVLNDRGEIEPQNYSLNYEGVDLVGYQYESETKKNEKQSSSDIETKHDITLDSSIGTYRMIGFDFNYREPQRGLVDSKTRGATFILWNSRTDDRSPLDTEVTGGYAVAFEITASTFGNSYNTRLYLRSGDKLGYINYQNYGWLTEGGIGSTDYKEGRDYGADGKGAARVEAYFNVTTSSLLLRFFAPNDETGAYSPKSYSTVIGPGSNFTLSSGGSWAPTQEEFSAIFTEGAGDHYAKPSVLTRNSMVTLYNVRVGEELPENALFLNTADNTLTDAYTAGQEGIVLNGESDSLTRAVFDLSNGNTDQNTASAGLAKGSNAYLRFKLDPANGSFKWYPFRTATGTSAGRGMLIEYDAATGELSFSFYSGTSTYRKQTIATTKALADGETHVLGIQLAAPGVYSTDSAGLLAGKGLAASGANVYYCEGTFTLDGSPIEGAEPAYYPAENTLAHWSRTDGSSSTSQPMQPGGGREFINAEDYGYFSVSGTLTVYDLLRSCAPYYDGREINENPMIVRS